MLTETCSTDEAAKILGVSPNTVRRRIASGELEAHTEHGYHRVPLTALNVATNEPTRTQHLQRLEELPALLDAATVAPILGMSPHSVRYHIRHGALPSRKLGRRVLIPTAALADFLNGSDR